MTEVGRPTVMIVEDEVAVAEGYELLLRQEYEVKIASGGKDALGMIDETVDIVLLDRMMPDISGEEVLAEIRTKEVDCRVAMVTAVEPDFDIIEMGFDEYITKPPSREELHSTIERMLERSALDEELQEYYSLVTRRSALQAEKSSAELEESEEYTGLLRRIEEQTDALDSRLGELSSDTDFVGAVREISDEE